MPAHIAKQLPFPGAAAMLVDTLRIDYVMFVTDPEAIQGGQFQYCRGTKKEFRVGRKAGKVLDEVKIMSPKMPGPDCVILQQGNMVVHRAKSVSAPGSQRLRLKW